MNINFKNAKPASPEQMVIVQLQLELVKRDEVIEEQRQQLVSMRKKIKAAKQISQSLLEY